MTPKSVTLQIHDVISRMIRSGISHSQSSPAVKTLAGGIQSIGDTPTTALALKNTPYKETYDEIDKNNGYHLKLADGALVIFQYRFDAADMLLKHRLAFFPSPTLPTFDEAPGLYEDDELYADIRAHQIVRFPVRFDYDPAAHVNGIHPVSHLSLGQFENCRIPVAAAISPICFSQFLLRNFYHNVYIRHKNIFDKRAVRMRIKESISEHERKMCHLVGA